jgi:hypothetical protein
MLAKVELPAASVAVATKLLKVEPVPAPQPGEL